MNASRVLLTRPAPQSETLSDLLTAQGVTPIVCPVIEIAVLLDAKALRDAWFQWRNSNEEGLVVLTSARTVEFLVDAKVEIDQPCAAVGPRTQQAVQNAGWPSVAVAPTDGASLSRELIAAGYAIGEIWFPCSRKAESNLEDELEKSGASVTRVDVYEPVAKAEQLVELAKDMRSFDTIVFHSSSAVDAAVDAIGAERLEGIEVICVGPSTSLRAQRRGLRVAAVAALPTDEGVLAAIALTADRRSSIIGAT